MMSKNIIKLGLQPTLPATLINAVDMLQGEVEPLKDGKMEAHKLCCCTTFQTRY